MVPMYNIMGFFFITFKTTNNQLSESWRVFVIPNKCQSQQLQQAEHIILFQKIKITKWQNAPAPPIKNLTKLLNY